MLILIFAYKLGIDVIPFYTCTSLGRIGKHAPDKKVAVYLEFLPTANSCSFNLNLFNLYLTVESHYLLKNSKIYSLLDAIFTFRLTVGL